MMHEEKGISNLIEVGLVVGIILAIAGYFLVVEGNQPVEEATVGQWYMIDYTEHVGPDHKGLVKVTHDTWTKKGSKVASGGGLNWSGVVEWAGPANEDLSTYGRILEST